MKRFHWQQFGRAQYGVSFHDGIKKHNDGSDFFDMRIFHNKKKLLRFVRELINSGYAETNW